MSYSLPSKAQAMRAQLSVLEAAATRPTLPFGDARIDQRLPGGGLPLGCWHEAGGEGLEIETAVAAAAFVAALAAPLAETGDVVWVMRRDDLYAPGLAGLGFPAERLIQVCVKDQAAALRVLEEALTSPGVATAIGEAEVPDLVAGRRLQLACEIRGATGFLIRRRMFGSASQAHGSTAMSRWKIASTPSEPRAGEPGLGAPRWRVDLERCRGGRPGAWIMEKTDGPLPLRVVAELGDRQLAPPLSRVG